MGYRLIPIGRICKIFRGWVHPNLLVRVSTLVLAVRNLSKKFGEFAAVDRVSFDIELGSITGLIGPNGAGKTTLFNTINGYYPPTSGKVYLDSKDITGFPPHKLFSKGVLRTFQKAHEFSTLTVWENLMVVPSNQLGEKFTQTCLARRKIIQQEKKIKAQAQKVLEFLELEEVADLPAGNLSGGQKKLLELGRTMMVDARIVFLDEVAAGVNRTLLKKITRAILSLNQQYNYTFCLIEHDMDFIGALCNPVICMAEGRILTQGTMSEVTNNEEVIQAYLGARAKDKALQ